MSITVDEVVVNRWLLRAAERRRVRVLAPDTIAVTEVTFPCLLKPYLDRTRKRLPTPVEALKTIGSEIHAMIQDVLRDDGWDVEVGLGLKVGDFKLVGRADAVKFDTVIEIKTSDGVKESLLRSHELQLQAYMQLLQLGRGFLIYIDRGSGRVKVFKVKADKKALREVVDRAKILHDALVRSRPPPPTRGPWCEVCPHKWFCWSKHFKEARAREASTAL